MILLNPSRKHDCFTSVLSHAPSIHIRIISLLLSIRSSVISDISILLITYHSPYHEKIHCCIAGHHGESISHCIHSMKDLRICLQQTALASWLERQIPHQIMISDSDKMSNALQLPVNEICPASISNIRFFDICFCLFIGSHPSAI